jgi:hypothetical protein
MNTEFTRTLGAAAVTAGTAAVLATVRDGWLDLGDGLVLVGALAVLGRGVIRLASEPGEARRLRR